MSRLLTKLLASAALVEGFYFRKKKSDPICHCNCVPCEDQKPPPPPPECPKTEVPTSPPVPKGLEVVPPDELSPLPEVPKVKLPDSMALFLQQPSTDCVCDCPPCNYWDTPPPPCVLPTEPPPPPVEVKEKTPCEDLSKLPTEPPPAATNEAPLLPVEETVLPKIGEKYRPFVEGLE